MQISQIWGLSGVWTVKRERVSQGASDVDAHNTVTSEMAGDVISFRASCTTIFPFASEAKVVSTLPTDVVVAEVVVEDFGVCVGLPAVYPKADQGGFVRGVRDWGRLLFRGSGFRYGWLWGAFSPC